MKFWLISILFSLVGANSAFAEPVAKRIAELPNKVKSTDGKATLFVDWERGEKGNPTAFLINRTDKPIVMETNLDRCYLYLEAKNIKGEWERAQGYQLELCGVGMDQYSLQPGTWISQAHWAGSNAQDQTKRPARLRCYDAGIDVSSNLGRAIVDPRAIAWSKYDFLAISRANAKQLKEIIIRGDPDGTMTSNQFNPRTQAFWYLADPKHSRVEVLVILKSLIDGPNPELQENAARVLKQIESGK